jgi:hypothetical protein
MAISTLIALGTTALNSADVTINAGSGVTFTLLGNGAIKIESKDSTGNYVFIGSITTDDPVQQMFGPITFRAVREAVKPAWRPQGQEQVTLPVGLSMDA